MKTSTETTTYAQMGIAALLPGMQYMLERMQKELDQMRAMLTDYQETGERRVSTKRVAAGKNGWPADPEERKAEMRRRMAVRNRKLNPKYKDHPDHAEWAAKMARTRKRAWKAKSPEEQQAWLAKMQAGKLKAARKQRKNHGSVRALVNGAAKSMENVA